MQINPYLNFDGQTEEAFKFYEKVLGGKIEAMMRFEGTPMENHMPPEHKNKIMHASMEIDGEVLMASDAPPAHYTKPAGFSVSLQFDDVAKAEKVFKGLAEGGNVGMDFQKTFWARGFGMCTDRFGTPWIINCE